MPRLSIVIPVWGKLKQLEDTLVSVLQNRPDDCEVLVVLDEPYLDPYDLKDEVRFLDVPAGTSLPEAVNVGVAHSRAPVVHVLHCGNEVEEGWADTALTHFADPAVATVAPLVLHAKNRQRIVSAGRTYGPSGQVEVLGRGCPASTAGRFPGRIRSAPLVAGFYRRSALELAGLFTDEVADWLTTLDLSLTLEQAGFRTVLDTRCRVFSTSRDGWRGGALRRSLDQERFFWRWAPQGTWLQAIVAHGLAIVGESVAGLLRLATPAHLLGRLFGLRALGAGRRNEDRIAHLRSYRQTLAAPPVPHFRTPVRPAAR